MTKGRAASTGVMEKLLASVPELRKDWRAYKLSDAYGPGEPYNDLGWLAANLVRRMQTSSGSFDQLFDAIEGLLNRGSPELRELIASGFLEDLQNVSLNNSVDLSAWEPWLRPVTLSAWQAVRDLWNGELAPEDFNRYIKTGART